MGWVTICENASLDEAVEALAKSLMEEEEKIEISDDDEIAGMDRVIK